MTFHVLNGDALVERFLGTGLSGQMVVARECLIEGDLQGETPLEFYKTRARYIKATYFESEESYFTRVAGEYEKLMTSPDNTEFNLWFGYDLFCQANLWFVLSILYDLQIQKQIFVIYPFHLGEESIWQDYAGATSAVLKDCFNKRILFTKNDLELGKDLWTALKTKDLAGLERLSKQKSSCFPYLEAVCKAHIDRFPKEGRKGRPERIVEEIIEDTGSNFIDVFNQFSKREGVYGFGDCQVKPIYDKVLNDHKLNLS